MLPETEFYRLADHTLREIETALEPLYDRGDIDLEAGDESIAIIFSDGRQLLISRHTASRQLWLSSPVSGGLHYAHSTEKSQWRTANGGELFAQLTVEFKQLAGLEVAF